MLDFFNKLKNVFSTQVQDTSSPMSLDKVDFAKMLRNAAMVAGAAFVAYFSEHITSVNFGDFLASHVHIFNAQQWNLVLVPLIAGGLDAINKFFKGPEEKGKDSK